MKGFLVDRVFIPVAPCGLTKADEVCPICLRQRDCIVAGQKETRGLQNPSD
ncbi:MAG: hypothetical protein ACOY4Q_13985 [Bacillota bacterium]